MLYLSLPCLVQEGILHAMPQTFLLKLILKSNGKEEAFSSIGITQLWLNCNKNKRRRAFPLKYAERDISFYSVLSPFDTEGVATYKEEVEIKDGKRDGQI